MRGCPPHQRVPLVTKRTLPSGKKIEDSPWHNPMNPKQAEHHIPLLPSNLTMEKKMVGTFTTLLAQAAPIHQNQSTFSKVINSQNLPKSGSPRKERHSRRNLGLRHALPRKGPNGRRTQRPVILLDRKVLGVRLAPA